MLSPVAHCRVIFLLPAEYIPKQAHYIALQACHIVPKYYSFDLGNWILLTVFMHVRKKMNMAYTLKKNFIVVHQIITRMSLHDVMGVRDVLYIVSERISKQILSSCLVFRLTNTQFLAIFNDVIRDNGFWGHMCRHIWPNLCCELHSSTDWIGFFRKHLRTIDWLEYSENRRTPEICRFARCEKTTTYSFAKMVCIPDGVLLNGDHSGSTIFAYYSKTDKFDVLPITITDDVLLEMKLFKGFLLLFMKSGYIRVTAVHFRSCVHTIDLLGPVNLRRPYTTAMSQNMICVLMDHSIMICDTTGKDYEPKRWQMTKIIWYTQLDSTHQTILCLSDTRVMVGGCSGSIFGWKIQGAIPSFEIEIQQTEPLVDSVDTLLLQGDHVLCTYHNSSNTCWLSRHHTYDFTKDSTRVKLAKVVSFLAFGGRNDIVTVAVSPDGMFDVLYVNDSATLQQRFALDMHSVCAVVSFGCTNNNVDEDSSTPLELRVFTGSGFLVFE